MTTIMTEQQMQQKILRREPFEATIDTGGFRVKIEHYNVPVIVAAIHNGGNLRADLLENCLLTQDERLFEEDPHTDDFIQDQPITFIGNDSRYEYDLNRDESECLYEEAWGKPVWKTPLTDDQKAKSLEKHRQFFRLGTLLAESLRQEFGACLLIGTHSYNWRRRTEAHCPVLNVGTSTVTNPEWRPVIDKWVGELNKIEVEGMDIDAKENDVFFGHGFCATYCHANFDNVLVLATEFKKVYMDERTGESFPEVVQQLRVGYDKAIKQVTDEFMHVIKGDIGPVSLDYSI